MNAGVTTYPTCSMSHQLLVMPRSVQRFVPNAGRTTSWLSRFESGMSCQPLSGINLREERSDMKKEEIEVMNVEGGSSIKMWTNGVPVESEARQQLRNTAKMPFIYKHIAVMPDVHLGKGSTIGS